ncbi:MAG: class I SAM-dependent methyltransferase [Leptothrix sp. (in: b-proteobacteria)]
MNDHATAATPSPTLSGFALPTGTPAPARAVLRLLQRLAHGTLELQLPDGSHARFGSGAGPRASMRLLDWRACNAVLRSGDIGLAEAYIAGHWHTHDLAGLLGLLLANRDALERMVYGSWWGALAYRLRHLLNRNSERGSRRNIHAHYDLGNTFYSRWLDPSMNYSSAWFDGNFDQPLEQAQHAKMRRALLQAQVQPGQRVLEIGCGWGAVAELAARDFGAHLTGVTLSTEQLAWGRQRLMDAGLSDRTDLRLQDYRAIDDAPFDAVVSIEMFEAVGRSYWPTYFETVARCLKPGGRACIQSITIRDDLFERYARSTDFIQQYIFPGGMLPSPSEFHRAAQAAGLVVEQSHSFGADYAETLRRWRTRFLAESAALHNLGFDARFMRTWEFYLGYCEAAFDAGNTDVVQFTLRRS